MPLNLAFVTHESDCYYAARGKALGTELPISEYQCLRNNTGGVLPLLSSFQGASRGSLQVQYAGLDRWTSGLAQHGSSYIFKSGGDCKQAHYYERYMEAKI